MDDFVVVGAPVRVKVIFADMMGSLLVTGVELLTEPDQQIQI